MVEDDSFGEATTIQVMFYLDNQGQPSIQNPIPVIFATYLYDFETLAVGQEINITGTLYKITRLDSHNGFVFLEPMVSKRTNRSKPDKTVPHDQWAFTEI
jgi:hypothetical protein